MAKPVWVYIHWSENKAFTEKSVLTFKDFELKCNRVAKEVGYDNGYDKTKIKVLFDDGEYYECRLDLCAKEDNGFRDHCEGVAKWVGSERFMKTYGDVVKEYERLKDYINSIVWE